MKSLVPGQISKKYLVRRSIALAIAIAIPIYKFWEMFENLEKKTSQSVTLPLKGANKMSLERNKARNLP